MRRGVHRRRVCSHLVATCASLAVLRGVVIRRAVNERDGHSDDECESEAGEFEVTHHERKAVPFQLRTSDADA